MVKLNNKNGDIVLSEDYFATLVGNIATTCYGVSGMVTSGPFDGIRSLLTGGKEFPDKGVKVKEVGNRLEIEIHIKVIYGLNISAIVKSITNKVKYAVESATGLTVSRIDVCVDEMEAE